MLRENDLLSYSTGSCQRDFEVLVPNDRLGLRCVFELIRGTFCKLASLTAEVAPVKSPKDHVATRGPGTPKVHHGTQNAVQVVVHLRNTQASSRKELPAALRRRSGHESSADWLTATEQRDKNVAAAYSCLFSSVPSFYLPSSVLSFYSSSIWFYSGLSFYWALVLSPLLSYSYCSCCYSLHRSSLYSSSSRRYCLHLRGSSSVPSSGVFFSSTSSPSSIVESAADVSSSSAPSSNLRVGQPVVRGATFLHQHLSVRIILIESLVAAVIPQVFQRPSQCASIGSLSLVAPTAILIKLFFLLSLLSAGCVCGSVGRCFLSLCVLSCSTG